MAEADKSPQDLFARVLAIDPQLAAILVANGFTTLEEVGYVPIDELMSIEEFDAQQVQDWRARARTYLLNQALGSEGDQGPLAVDTSPRPKPMSGGAGTALNDNDSSHGSGKA